jgi:hypothetical protein
LLLDRVLTFATRQHSTLFTTITITITLSDTTIAMADQRKAGTFLMTLVDFKMASLFDEQLSSRCRSSPITHHRYHPYVSLFFMSSSSSSRRSLVTSFWSSVIKNADMSDAMQQDAVDIASIALSKYNIEKVSAA